MDFPRLFFFISYLSYPEIAACESLCVRITLLTTLSAGVFVAERVFARERVAVGELMTLHTKQQERDFSCITTKRASPVGLV